MLHVYRWICFFFNFTPLWNWPNMQEGARTSVFKVCSIRVDARMDAGLDAGTLAGEGCGSASSELRPGLSSGVLECKSPGVKESSSPGIVEPAQLPVDDVVCLEHGLWRTRTTMLPEGNQCHQCSYMDPCGRLPEHPPGALCTLSAYLALSLEEKQRLRALTGVTDPEPLEFLSPGVIESWQPGIATETGSGAAAGLIVTTTYLLAAGPAHNPGNTGASSDPGVAKKGSASGSTAAAPAPWRGVRAKPAQRILRGSASQAEAPAGAAATAAGTTGKASAPAGPAATAAVLAAAGSAGSPIVAVLDPKITRPCSPEGPPKNPRLLQPTSKASPALPSKAMPPHPAPAGHPAPTSAATPSEQLPSPRPSAGPSDRKRRRRPSPCSSDSSSSKDHITEGSRKRKGHRGGKKRQAMKRRLEMEQQEQRGRSPEVRRSSGVRQSSGFRRSARSRSPGVSRPGVQERPGVPECARSQSPGVALRTTGGRFSLTVRSRSKDLMPQESAFYTQPCQEFYDPASGRLVRHSGQHPKIRQRVRSHASFPGLVQNAIVAARNAQEMGRADAILDFVCNRGRHRSVAVAEEVAGALRREGFLIRVRHASAGAWNSDCQRGTCGKRTGARSPGRR